MKIVVFGATGKVGLHLLRQALNKNYQVRAFGRDAHTLPIPNKNLELIKGAVFDDEQVLDSISGVDAVLSVLNGSGDGQDKTRSLGVKIIIEQMQKAGVKRIIALGGFGVLSSPDGGFLSEMETFPPQYVSVSKEHQLAYEYLRASDLDWTFVCSPRIIDADPTGKFMARIDYPPESKHFEINAGDVALFMLEDLETNKYLHQRVGITSR
jgi:putative NADH-flavin reductase